MLKYDDVSAVCAAAGVLISQCSAVRPCCGDEPIEEGAAIPYAGPRIGEDCGAAAEFPPLLPSKDSRGDPVPARSPVPELDSAIGRHGRVMGPPDTTFHAALSCWCFRTTSGVAMTDPPPPSHSSSGGSISSFSVDLDDVVYSSPGRTCLHPLIISRAGKCGTDSSSLGSSLNSAYWGYSLGCSHILYSSSPKHQGSLCGIIHDVRVQ